MYTLEQIRLAVRAMALQHEINEETTPPGERRALMTRCEEYARRLRALTPNSTAYHDLLDVMYDAHSLRSQWEEI